MSVPYTLVEKSVLRKPNSTKTIGDVLTETTAWLQALQEGTSVSNFFYYAEVVDSDTKARYFVYSEEAKQYFGLSNNIIEADSVSGEGSGVPNGGTTGQILIKNSDNDGEAVWADIPTAQNSNLLDGKTYDDIVTDIKGHNVTAVENLGLKYVTVSWTNVYPSTNSHAPFVTNWLNSTIDNAQKIDNYRILLKAGRTYKIDGGIEGLTTAGGAITLRFEAFKNDGTKIDLPADVYTYQNDDQGYIRRYDARGYYTPTEDVKLMLLCTSNTLVSPSYIAGEFTITEYTPNRFQLDTLAEMPGYKTEEVLTEKRWIDGKPIYRKVLDIDNLILDGTTHEELIMNPNWNIENIVASETRWNHTIIDHGWDWRNAIYSRELTVAPNYIRYRLGTSSGIKTIQLMIEYTKTTDTSSSPTAMIQAQTKTPVIFSAKVAKSEITDLSLGFTTLNVDTHNISSEDRVTIPEEGIYEIHLEGIVQNIGQLNIMKNGATLSSSYELTTTDGRGSMASTIIVNLLKDDEITFMYNEIDTRGAMFNEGSVYIKKIN